MDNSLLLKLSASTRLLLLPAALLLNACASPLPPPVVSPPQIPETPAPLKTHDSAPSQNYSVKAQDWLRKVENWFSTSTPK